MQGALKSNLNQADEALFLQTVCGVLRISLCTKYIYIYKKNYKDSIYLQKCIYTFIYKNHILKENAVF